MIWQSVDCTHEDDPTCNSLRECYHLDRGLPVVLLLDRSGREVVRFTEAMPPERLVAALESVE